MEKTKIGLSAGILGAVAYLIFLFGGYAPGLLLVGYILLCETDTDLKTTAVTALAAALAFSLVNMVIGLLPDIVGIFESLLNIFGIYSGYNVLNNIFNFLYNIVSLAKTVIMVLLGVASLLGKPVLLAPIKKLMN